MRLAAILLVVLVVAPGCGPGGASVSGVVNVDGKPLHAGVISFVPADGNGAPITVPIKDGAYQLETVAGSKRVQISAPVVVGKRKEHNGPDAPLVEIRAESLPDRFNSKTELTFETRSGSNHKDWDLVTGKAK